MARPKPTLPTLLDRLGRAAYGAHWQSELARDLSVSRRTVARWASGRHRIQPYYLEQIPRCIRWRMRADRDHAFKLLKQIKNLPKENYYKVLQTDIPVIYVDPWKKI